MDEAVDSGDGHGIAAEDLAPAADRFVGDHQQRAVVVACADEFEERTLVSAPSQVTLGEVVEDEEVLLVEFADGSVEGEVPARRWPPRGRRRPDPTASPPQIVSNPDMSMNEPVGGAEGGVGR